MPFDGNGTYSLPSPAFPAVSGTAISSADYNAILTDIATALSDCLTRDGQSVATANVPMGNFRITALGNPVASTDAVNRYWIVNKTETDALFTQAGTGVVQRTFQEKMREVQVSVKDFGATGDGATDDRAAIQRAIDAVIAAGGGIVYFPRGIYRLVKATGADSKGNGLLVPFVSQYGTATRVRLVGEDRSTVLQAASDDMIVIRFCDSNGGVENFTIDGNSHTGVYGLGLVPQNMTQTATLVYQNFNQVNNLFVKGCDEGLVMQCGPDVGGGDSGCWYNSVSNVHLYYCVRGIWMKDGPNASSSGVNRNNFHNVRIGGVTNNTGVQIDSGGTNHFYGLSCEGIANGTSPNATPTGVKIKASGTYSSANESNRFFGWTNEANTRDLENANGLSEFYGCNIRNGLYTQKPLIQLGGYSPSDTPQRAMGLVYQTNNQFAGFANTLNVETGQLAFPAVQLASSDPNVLDDYEEGTWTPTLNSTGFSGPTYATQVGKYIKIGKHVYIWGQVTLSALTAGGTNFLRIEGLPFTVRSAESAFSMTWGNLTGGTPSQFPAAQASIGQTSVNFYEMGVDGPVGGVGMSGARLTTTSTFVISGMYITDN